MADPHQYELLSKPATTSIVSSNDSNIIENDSNQLPVANQIIFRSWGLLWTLIFSREYTNILPFLPAAAKLPVVVVEVLVLSEADCFHQKSCSFFPWVSLAS